MDRTVLTTLIGLSALLVGCGRAALTPKPAPDFAVETVTVPIETVRLSKLKGKVVVIDFWATWCGPCRETMPQLDRLYRDFRDKGLELLAISGEARATLRAFKANVTYPLLCDVTGEANRAYNVEAIPRTLVVDRAGRIVYDQVGLDDGSALRQAVEAALRAK